MTTRRQPGERKGVPKENKGKENILNIKGKKEKSFAARPVMKKTSEFEVNIFVVGYEINGLVPICGDHISHANRYWTIAALHKKYPKDFTIAELSRHFGICERVFRGEYKKKIYDRMEDYNYLSPSENVDSSRKLTIKKYGRTKDMIRYMDKRNKV